MIEMPTQEFYVISSGHIDGVGYPLGPDVPCLDLIATEHYGREYQGQQTGDMLRNDSITAYQVTSYTIMDILEEWTQEHLDSSREWAALQETSLAFRHLNLADTLPKDVEHSGGRGWIRTWLEMDESGDTYGFDVPRAAPTPDVILCDLADKGIIPKGTYLLHVSW